MAVPHHDRPADPDELFGSFLRELAPTPGRAALLVRLRIGHGPDEYDWCRHPWQAHHREKHPCPALRLAQLVKRAGGQEQAEQSPG